MNSPKVSQEARDKASEIVRQGAPGVGNGNAVIANEIKGGLHDDYFVVQSFAQFEQLIRSKVIEAAAAGETGTGSTVGESPVGLPMRPTFIAQGLNP